MRKIFTLIFMIFCLASTSLAKDQILIFKKNAEDYHYISGEISKKLKSNYDIKEFELKDDYNEFKKSIEENKPKLIITMDNIGVNFSKKFFEERPKTTFHAVAIMGLNYKKILKGQKNICGISYEIPPYSLLTQARYAITNKKIKNILAFYRGSLFGDFVSEAKEQLNKEKINLNAIDLDQEDLTTYFETKGKALIEAEKDKYDGIYVLLDNILINSKTFPSFWAPLAAKNVLPLFIGEKKFAQPAANFALFGMGPNLSDLADQTSQMVMNILEDGQNCQEIGVEELIGVDSFWNAKKAKELGVELNPSAKENIKVLE